MAATPHFGFPQYLTTDPADLTALNSGLSTLDTQAYAAIQTLTSPPVANVYTLPVTGQQTYRGLTGSGGTVAGGWTTLSSAGVTGAATTPASGQINAPATYRVEAVLWYRNTGNDGGYNTRTRLAFSGTGDTNSSAALATDLSVTTYGIADLGRIDWSYTADLLDTGGQRLIGGNNDGVAATVDGELRCWTWRGYQRFSTPGTLSWQIQVVDTGSNQSNCTINPTTNSFDGSSTTVRSSYILLQKVIDG